MSFNRTLSRARNQLGLWRYILALAFKLSVVIVASSSTFAMNWEGHDDWLIDEAHAQTLHQNAPKAKPLPQPYPLCAARAELHARNPYEQRPIAGINCIDSETETDRPLH